LFVILKQILTFSIFGILQIAAVSSWYSILLYPDVVAAEMSFDIATCIVDVIIAPSSQI
jgi:hypothetical protein